MTVGPGLGLQRFGGATLLRLAGELVGIRIVRTKTAISGRVGTVPGAGTAYRVRWDGTDLSDGDEFDLLNISAAGGGSGLYGVAVRVFGAWWIAGLECGAP